MPSVPFHNPGHDPLVCGLDPDDEVPLYPGCLWEIHQGQLKKEWAEFERHMRQEDNDKAAEELRLERYPKTYRGTP